MFYNITMSEVTNRFLQLNKSRLANTLELMPSRQRPFIQLMPLLFHSTDEIFPGNHSRHVPGGICNYIPDSETISQVKNIWRSYVYKDQVFQKYDIEALFLMGSCGTVAFNAESDFDVWVCHRSGLSSEELQALRLKATEIEKWYEDKDIEAHFFLMNAEEFKSGKVSKLSSESSGSAQFHLLRDEFYRTSIWMAGKKPLWWEITAEEEKVYEKSKQRLADKGLIDLEDYIDFGGMPIIPKGEFFGAAVWQIYKGIDSPHKSVLKITLMESYAESYPIINPLCALFKQKVYDGETDPIALDAYLMLFSRLDSYLKRKSELSRLETVRRSFYLKLSLPLSNEGLPDNWRKNIIEQLVKVDWGWSQEKLKRLDNQKNWLMEDVVAERKLLVSHLTNSYAFVSKFARKYASKRLIKPKDLTILGRKLYSAFDRKPGKVEIFNRGIAEHMAEKNVTFRLFFSKDGRELWHVYRGKVIGDQYKARQPLKQTYSITELLAWAYINKLVSMSTQKLMYAPGSTLGNTELKSLSGIVEKVLSTNMPMTPDSRALMKGAVITSNAIFVNLGKQVAVPNVNTEQAFITGELDVFNCGGENHCFVESLDYLYVTSWKEIFAFKFFHADGIASWLCSILNMYRESYTLQEKEIDISLAVYSFGGGIAHILSSRLNVLCKTATKYLLSRSVGEYAYVYQAAKQFYLIKYEDDHFDFEKFSNLENFLKFLSLPRDKYASLVCDFYVDIDLPLSEIYKVNRADTIQLFCYEQRETVHLFIIDELGILFYQQLPLDDSEKILQHNKLFFQSILERRHIDEDLPSDFDDLSEPVEGVVEMYKVVNTGSQFLLEKVNTDVEFNSGNFDIQVLAQQVDNKAVFTFYCDDVEFSTLDFGSEVFNRVANHIMEQRGDYKDYYLYITDLELSPELMGKKVSQKVQTCELLKYKKRIESHLNKKTRLM